MYKSLIYKACSKMEKAKKHDVSKTHIDGNPRKKEVEVTKKE